MAERGIVIRLSLQDAEKVRVALEKTGTDGQAALRRIETASAPASRGLLALNAASREVQGSITGWANRIPVLGSALGALGPAGLAAAAGIGAVTLGLGSALRQFAEAEQVGLRLDAVLKATGNTTGLTRREIDALSESLAGVDDEAVARAITTLATFRNVSGQTFKDAIRLADDLAAVFGRDLESATKTLARALNDPVEGLSALKRAGIAFNETQRDTIAAMVDAGDVAGAQQRILGELEERIGGSGAAGRSGLTGATDSLAVAFGNLAEEIGGLVASPIQGFLAGLAGEIGRIAAAIAALQSGDVSGLGESLGDFSVLGYSARDFPASAAIEEQRKKSEAEIARLRELRKVEEAEGRRLADELAVMIESESPAGLVSQQQADVARRSATIAEIDRQLRKLQAGTRPAVGGLAMGAPPPAKDFASTIDALLAVTGPKRVAEEREAEARIAAAAEEAELRGKLGLAGMKPRDRAVADVLGSDDVKAALAGLSPVEAGKQKKVYEELAGAIFDVSHAETARGKATSEAAKASKAAEAEAKKQEEQFAALRDTLDPLGAAQRQFAEDQARIDAQLEAGNITLEQAVPLHAALEEKYREARDPLETMMEGLQREIDLLQLSAPEREIQAELIERVNELRKAGEPLTQDEIDGLEATLRARQKLNEETTRATELEEEAQRAAEARGEALSKALTDPIGRAFDRIGSSITEMFVRGKGAALDFASILDGIFSEIAQSGIELAAINPLKNLFRSAGDQLPTLFDMLGSSSSGGGSTGGRGGSGLFGFSLGDIGTSLFGSSFGSTSSAPGSIFGRSMFSSSGLFGTGSSFLADSFLPVLGGFAAPLLMGGSLTDSLFGGGAALAGAGIGSVIPGIGTAAGAAIGGLFGSLFGGLFGGSPPKPAANQFFTLGPSGFSPFSGGSASFPGDLQGTVTAAGGDWASGFQALLDQIGASLNDDIVAGLRLGSRGYGYKIVDDGRVVKDSSRAGNDGALETAVNNLSIDLLRYASNAGKLDADPIVQSLAGNVGSLDELSSLFSLARTVFKELRPDAISEAEQALRDLNAAFDEAAENAAKFGKTVEEIEGRRSDAIAEMIADFDKQIADAILGIEDPAALASQQLEAEIAARNELAKTIGGNIEAVERLNTLQREALEISNRSAQAELLKASLNADLLGGTSLLSPAEKLTEAQKQFGEALAAARDSKDVSGAIGAAAVLDQIAREMFASSSEFGLMKDFSRSSLENLGKQLGLPGFAAGTNSAPPGWAMVGERGTEFIRMRGGERVRTAAQMGAAFDTGRLEVATARGFGDLVAEVRLLRQENAQTRQEISLLREQMKRQPLRSAI